MHKTKKMTRTLSIFLAFLFLFSLAFPGDLSGETNDNYNSSPFNRAEIHPDVQELLSAGGDPVEALIMLKERPDTGKIADAVKRHIRPFATPAQEKSVTRHTVVNTLRDVAEKTQQIILDFLKAENNKKHVSEMKSFYIVNSVYVEASPQIIKAISLNPAVDKILPKKTFTLQTEQHDYAGGDSDTGDGGIEDDTNSDAGYEVSQTMAEPASGTAEWGIRRIGADKVWDEFQVTGEGAVIGVMDTGAEWEHPALQEKWRGYNPDDPDNSDPEFNWYDAVYGRYMPRDVHTSNDGYHGTHVTGTTVGSAGNNLIGTAPGAQWIAANVFDNNLEASNILIMDAGEYMLAPTCEDGMPHPDMAPDIINASWGAPATGNLHEDEELRTMVQSWRDAGILPVIAACNYGPDSGTIGSPAMYPESFAVGATNSSDSIYSKSARGPVPHYPDEIKPDISAPGVSINSSFSSSGYENKTGTSMATPHVAGTAALLLSADPDLTAGELEKLMTDTATPLPGPDSSPNNDYGYGLVNAYKAAENVLRDVVIIVDDNLEKAVREKLDIPEGVITEEDMESITDLNAGGLDIESLAGLEHAVNLEVLDLSDNRLDDLSPLESLVELKTLHLSENEIDNTAPLDELINLQDLNISHNLLTDISPLIANSNNGGLGDGDTLDLRYNRLDLAPDSQASADIEQLKNNDVTVQYGMQVLPRVSPPEWSGPGIISWTPVKNSSEYKLVLSEEGDGIEVASDTVNPDNDYEYDFASEMRDNGRGEYRVTLQAKGDGDLYTDGEKSEKSPAYNPIELAQIEKPAWDSKTITWNALEETNIYRVKLYKDYELFRTVTLNIPGVDSFDFADSIEEEDEIDYTAAVRALGDGAVYTDGPLSEESEPYDPDKPEPDPFKEAEEAVNALFDGDKLAEGVTEEDIDDALALVNELEDGEDKDELLAKIDLAYDLYENYEEPVNGVYLNEDSMQLVEGESKLLIPTVTPDNAANKNVNWSSENTAIATVNQHGEVYALSEGSTVITVETEDGGYTASCQVEVKSPGDIPEVIFTDPADNDPDVSVNKIIRIRFDKEIQPGDNFEDITLKYNDTEHYIEDTVIDETNKSVLYLKPENDLNYDSFYTVTLPADSVRDMQDIENQEYTFHFDTGEEPDEPVVLESISLNAVEFTLIAGGATATLVPIIEPENATDWEISWSSDDDSIATVTQNLAGDGIITPLATGETTITATVVQDSEEYQAQCLVKVIKYGDISGSGEIDISDAIMLLRKIVGLTELTELQQEAGNVTGNEELSVADAILILRFIVDLIDEFPVMDI